MPTLHPSSQPAAHIGARATASSCRPEVPSGKRTMAMAMWLFSTKVNMRR